ncbi:MAG: porin [Hyphomicrobiales bacterium]|nr:porin [Hyphomicrobiales bacterium]MDE2113511.1 porin [Hyphomicrobiales bacterium]
MATAAFWLVLQPACVLAEGLPRLHGSLPTVSRQAASPCAAYGAGFVAVAGSSSCVRISGHVRLDYNWGGRGDSGVGDMLAPPSEYQADPAPPYARVRPPLLDKPHSRPATWHRNQTEAW